MRTLAIASGNTLRRDDGVAHYVLALLNTTEKRSTLQLSIELSQEIAAFDNVIFIDADAGQGEPRIELINTEPTQSPLTHRSGAADIVHLARSLYGFTGTAWLCRIPVADFGYGEALTPEAIQSAQSAAVMIEHLLRPIAAKTAATN